MKKAMKFIVFFSAFIYVTILFSSTTNNNYYKNLLEIESAKKLYKKKHYSDALNKLLTVASIATDTKIKSETIAEIAYVKYLSGYSSRIYENFIKKALEYNNNLSLNSDYDKKFLTIFKNIKKNTKKSQKKTDYKEKIIYMPSKNTVNSVNSMEIKENLIFKMKKKLASLKELAEEQSIKIKKSSEIIKYNKNKIKILNKEISRLKSINSGNYKKKYKKIKLENKKLYKEIEVKNNLLKKLSGDLKIKEGEILKLNSLLKEKSLPKKVKEKKIIQKNKVKTNPFKTLQSIWKKKII